MVFLKALIAPIIIIIMSTFIVFIYNKFGFLGLWGLMILMASYFAALLHLTNGGLDE